MTFQTVPINIAGPSYSDRSRPLSSQSSVNMYPDVVESGKTQLIMRSFPGYSGFGNTTAGEDRGQTNMAEVIYRVVGTSLYSVDSSGSHTSLGTIAGSGRCVFANDGANLAVVAGTTVYVYDGSSLTQVTDTDIDGAKSVTYINNQFIYTKDLISIVSNVGDPTTASSLNVIGAESSPDDLMRDYVFDQVIYRFGVRTTEQWYNSGVGNPPIARIEGQMFSVGLGALHAINHTQQALYFLGSDRRLYRTRGGVEEVVSTDALEMAFQDYTVSDAFIDSFVYDGKTFLYITFPTEQKTWCLVEDLGNRGWFELKTGTIGAPFPAYSIQNIYNKVILGHKDNGYLYSLSWSDYDHAGETFQRIRTTSSINSIALGDRGKRVQMSRFELLLETGTGIISGQGEDPKIMVEYSTDGGRSWSTGTWMRIGRLGQFNARAEWYSLISFYDLILRFTISDPVSVTLYDAAIDLRLAGR